MAMALALLLGGAVGCTLLTPLGDLSGGADPADGVAPVTTRTDGETSAPLPDGASSTDAPPVDGGTGSRYAAAVLSDKPLLYYRFGEKSGSPARDEVSGATTPYPVTGITYGTAGHLAGDPDTAVTTDGSGALALTQATDFDGVKPFSVEAWLSPSTMGNGIGFFVDHESWTADRAGWLVLATNGGYAFERYTALDASPSNSTVAASVVAVAGEWHHLVGTYDGTTGRLYIDGVRRDTGVTAVPLPANGMPFSVGKQNCTPCSGTGFVGAMDELAIYPTALAEDRISAHFAAAAGP
jgi:hypothetical protein